MKPDFISGTTTMVGIKEKTFFKKVGHINPTDTIGGVFDDKSTDG